ncbi:MAG: BrnT family toxin [Alphaproteobacteria bacterium]|nr:BrnT family toxin [Alphaproteobacteria bacterium]
MEFEWNKAKSEACHAERGFDFAYAVRVFLDPDRLVEPDDRIDYGEPRYRVLGRIERRIFVIVCTPRGNRFRLISARKANEKEIRRYEAGPRDAEA